MHPRTRPIIAAAVVLVLCRAATHPSEATVVRDGKAGPFNPAVESGGHRLTADDTDKRSAATIPYSLIGALQAAYYWFPPCIGWSASMFGPFWHHHGVHGHMAMPPFVDRPVNGTLRSGR